MRLHMESSTVEPATTLLNVTGIIDWSTLAQFRTILTRHVSHPRPHVVVDLSGLLSWSPEAQAVLVRATRQAQLLSGQLAVVGLALLPSVQAASSGLYRMLKLFPSQQAALAAMPTQPAAPRSAATEPLVGSR